VLANCEYIIINIKLASADSEPSRIIMLLLIVVCLTQILTFFGFGRRFFLTRRRGLVVFSLRPRPMKASESLLDVNRELTVSAAAVTVVVAVAVSRPTLGVDCEN